MAQATTEPQLDELKKRARRRLVGAIVLALIAAVVVPMLLESDPKPLGEDVSVRIPPVDEGRFVNKVGEQHGDKAAAQTPAKPPAEPGAGGSAAKPEAAGEATSSPSAGATAPDPVRDKARASLSEAERRVIAPPTRTPDAAKPPADASKAASEPPRSAPETTKAATPDAARSSPDAAKAAPAVTTKADSGYSVQLAAFADDKGANALAGKLKRAGYSAYTEPYSTSRGTLWRVRVGPFASRDAAESARDKLKGEGQNGIITAARP